MRSPYDEASKHMQGLAGKGSTYSLQRKRLVLPGAPSAPVDISIGLAHRGMVLDSAIIVAIGGQAALPTSPRFRCHNGREYKPHRLFQRNVLPRRFFAFPSGQTWYINFGHRGQRKRRKGVSSRQKCLGEY
ncbi:hypothetical protein BDZ89DRAFT_1078230, partial [Hymenopellis radicata]